MPLVHEQLSYQVLGSLFDVMNEIGYGHKEQIYQKAVAVSLKLRKIPFQEQVHVKIYMADTPIGDGYLDFLIDGKIILELKANASFRASDYRQVLSYLSTTKLQLGILAAFTPSGVRFRRVLNIPGHPPNVTPLP